MAIVAFIIIWFDLLPKLPLSEECVSPASRQLLKKIYLKNFLFIFTASGLYTIMSIILWFLVDGHWLGRIIIIVSIFFLQLQVSAK